MTAPLVLIVEDSPDLSDLSSIVLEAEAYATRSTGTGAGALEAIEAGLRPQLILLDQGLPDMDGLAVVAALQRDPTLAAIPVVLVTGTQFTSVPPGVAHVLRKPHLPEDLVTIARTFCTPTACAGAPPNA